MVIPYSEWAEGMKSGGPSILLSAPCSHQAMSPFLPEDTSTTTAAWQQ